VSSSSPSNAMVITVPRAASVAVVGAAPNNFSVRRSNFGNGQYDNLIAIGSSPYTIVYGSGATVTAPNVSSITAPTNGQAMDIAQTAQKSGLKHGAVQDKLFLPGYARLLAVSKTFPADDVRALAGLGHVDFGENRVQELQTKAAALDGVPLRWHFIGQLQRNKAAAVARLGAVVHSVDRARLAEVLGRAGEEAGRPVDVLLQVALGGPEGEAAARGGADPAAVPGLADEVAVLPGVRTTKALGTSSPASS